jgi:ferritin
MIPKSTTQPKRNLLLSQEGITLLNFRIQQEELSSRVYLSMSMWLNNKGYFGAAKLWKKYSDEELKHADIARNYLLSFGVQPITPALSAPSNSYDGLPDIVKQSYNHEIIISKQCKELAAKALKEGDFMLYELALAYLKEQVEEHDKMQNWMDRLDTFGTDSILLRELDEEMGEI